MSGVRTRGTAGGGRREWYAALDLHRIAHIEASWAGTDLGGLRPVDPPVRFGFGSTPSRPSLVRVTTTIDLGAAPQSNLGAAPHRDPTSAGHVPSTHR
jgi:hypothetical protein